MRRWRSGLTRTPGKTFFKKKGLRKNAKNIKYAKKSSQRVSSRTREFESPSPRTYFWLESDSFISFHVSGEISLEDSKMVQKQVEIDLNVFQTEYYIHKRGWTKVTYDKVYHSKNSFFRIILFVSPSSCFSSTSFDSRRFTTL